MNILHKVTVQSLRRNRTRTVVTIIGIILSTAMICAVTTFAGSMYHYALREQIYTQGAWQGRVLGGSYGTYEKVRDSGETEQSAVLQQLGYAVAEGCTNRFKPYIFLLGAGEGADKVLPIHLTAGAFPASAEEILLPDHLTATGGIRYSLGDSLTLSLGQRVLQGEELSQATACTFTDDSGESVPNGERLEIREERTYTVVGFYERLPEEIEGYASPGFTAFTLADGEPSVSYAYDTYFKVKHPRALYAFMEENGLGDDTNQDLLTFYASSRYKSFMTVFYRLCAIVIGLILFGSVAVISNAFSISVSERTRQFGLLSSVGATGKQLRRMVLYEALIVSMVGIPLGILSGIGGIGVTLLFLGERFSNSYFGLEMTLSVSPVSVLLASSVALVAVMASAWIPSRRAAKGTAMEAIRQSRDVADSGKSAKTSRVTYALFGLPGVLASRNYKRSRKKYRVTVLSLFMSIVLFISASAFTDYLGGSVSDGMDLRGYDLDYTASAGDFDRLSPEELLQKIRGAKSVTGASCSLAVFGTEATVRREELTAEARNGLEEQQAEVRINPHLCFVDDDSYRQLLRQYDLDEGQFLDPDNPRAIALDDLQAFNRQTERYETFSYFREDEFEVRFLWMKEVPGYQPYTVVADENGDKWYQYVKTGTQEEFLDLTAREAVRTATLQVGKVIRERPAFLSSHGPMLIYPLRFSGVLLSGQDHSQQNYTFTIESAHPGESEQTLRTLLRENGFDTASLTNDARQEETKRDIVTIIRVFSYGFVALISLIALANVFNTVCANISLRRREYAMLESVGMSGKGFRQMMVFECLLYGSRALLLGLPVSCLVTWLIYRTVSGGMDTTFRLPWAAIAAAVVSVFAVVLFTMMYAMRVLRRKNIIDTLTSEVM